MAGTCALPPTYDECAKGFTDPSPSAPSVNEGFEPDEGFEKPPTTPPIETSAQERLPIVNLGTLSEEDVREACLEYVAEHCCYGKRFAREMVLTDIVNTHTYHYKLESYAEKRRTVVRSCPYRGGAIDGIQNGPPPAPWDIVVESPPNLFVKYKKEKKVPHSAHVEVCFKCNGDRWVTCDSCRGSGQESCFSCSGSGQTSDDERCSSCSGSGTRTCSTCGGRGNVECHECRGCGKLEHYKVLIVTWKNHVDYFISDTFNLPRELILNVTGRIILKEQYPKLTPISHVPEQSINQASFGFLQKHETSFPQELIRMQRQTLRAVPFAKVNYWWRNRTGECYVYGFEKKVYFEDYPQKCCCCVCC